MILAYEILQVRVCRLHLRRPAVEQLVGSDGRHRRLCYGVDVLCDDALAYSALVDEPQYVGMHRVVGEEHALVLKQHDVISCRREERFAHLTLLQRIHHVLKLLQRLSLLQPRQASSIHCRAVVVGALARQRGEVVASLEGVVYRVDAFLGFLLRAGRSVLSQSDENVGGLHKSSQGVNAGLRCLIHVPRLLLYVSVADERRTYLLVAVKQELRPEILGCVDACVYGCLHLQLVVDEQFGIFVHALLVDHGLRIVLVV